MTDTIADMLIRIKNAYLANKDQVQLPASKKLEAVANVLREAGYLSEVKVVTNDKNQRNLELSLLYSGVTPALTDVKRVSKPGCHVYVTVGILPLVTCTTMPPSDLWHVSGVVVPLIVIAG